jgi:enoyl reductase-like protein
MFSQVPDFKAWFPDIEEFPRPDWKAIREWIRQNVSVDRLDDAWQAITREWLKRICERLGKSYVVAESQSFHLVSELDEAKQTDLLSFLEKARAHPAAVRRHSSAEKPRQARHPAL